MGKITKKCNSYQYLMLEEVLFSIRFYVSKEEIFALNAKGIDNNTDGFLGCNVYLKGLL